MQSIVDSASDVSLMVLQQRIDALFATHTDITPKLRTKIESFELSNNAILDGIGSDGSDIF